jgi:hypothetical protein
MNSVIFCMTTNRGISEGTWIACVPKELSVKFGTLRNKKLRVLTRTLFVGITKCRRLQWGSHMCSRMQNVRNEAYQGGNTCKTEEME